ncbi:MAG: GGDEF domain-containing protein [Pseudomonadota bacterium]
MNLNAIIYNRELLGSLRLFKSVSTESIEQLLEKCQYRRVVAGETLLQPDTSNPFVYVIASGSLDVFLTDDTTKPLTTLQHGDCVGEMSMIENREPSALVIAKDNCDLLAIDHIVLAEMVNVSHGVAKNLLIILSERVRRDNDVIATSLSSMRKFEHSATRDALTDLHNRHWMQDMFRREIQRCKNRGTTACLMMIDVDRFKEFNDRAGHAAGDHALTKVADAFRAHLRPTDLIARFGGDEFAIFLPDLDLESCHETAERIRIAFSGDGSNPDGTDMILPITLSLGVTTMQPNDTLDTLIKKADKALYRAKEDGRNQCVVYDEI